MQVTNMDHNKKTQSNIPQLEFTLMIGDFDKLLRPGEKGEIIIPVEVTDQSKEGISFRKIGKARSTGNFLPPSVSDMEHEIGEGEQPEDRKRK